MAGGVDGLVAPGGIERCSTVEALAQRQLDAIGAGGKYKRKSNSNRRLSEKMRERNEIVKKVMMEQNLRLGPASKYVKEHGLWKN